MEQRQQRRIQAAIPVQVRGTDAKGEAFEEWYDAVDVSRRGLSFLTRRELPLHASLSIVLPGRGPNRPGEGPSDFFTTAAVVRATKAGEMNQVAVRFVGSTLHVYSSETI